MAGSSRVILAAMKSKWWWARKKSLDQRLIIWVSHNPSSNVMPASFALLLLHAAEDTSNPFHSDDS